MSPLTATNACSFQDDSVKCSIESILGRAPVYLAFIASNTAVAERFMATLCYLNYERYNYFFISIAIGAFPWVYQCLTVPSTILDAIRKPSTMLIYCNSISSIGMNFEIFISTISITTTGALIISIIIYIVNKRIKKFSSRNSGGRHLNVEFQRKENLEHTKIIAFQIVGLLFTYFLNAIIAMMIATPNVTTNLVIKKEFGSLCFPIYASVHVFLALWVSPTLRTKYLSTFLMKKFFGCFFLKGCFKVQVAPLSTPEDYFKYYQNQWS
uniref:Vomeronasal type-1 receptor n=1 Tax=Panagrolaimus sp. PS1159 TaxID=55785 RepID=A0AC35FDF0_9BILA